MFQPSSRSKSKKPRPARGRLLVSNCHEAWVHQLSALDFDLDIIVGLKGRAVSGWDTNMRPVPAGARLIRLDEALGSTAEYYCMIGHNISDLLDLKTRRGARLLVIHSTIEGKLAEEGSQLTAEQVGTALRTYVELVRAHVVSVSRLKGASWGFTDDIVPFAVRTADYPVASRALAVGLRISNFLLARPKILMWEFHKAAFDGLPMRIVGHNPDLPGVTPAADWSDLKEILRTHRFYVHTAEPTMEDGYNMATIEAMAAGLAVLGNVHPSSPVTHGVDGFLSDDPEELRAYAMRLIEDRELARKMGDAAKRTVEERFSLSKFKREFTRSVELAHAKWHDDKNVTCR